MGDGFSGFVNLRQSKPKNGKTLTFAGEKRGKVNAETKGILKK